MKKITSILLILAFFISGMCLNVFANEKTQKNTADNSLVFELDFSRYTEDGILTDAVGNAPLSLVGDANVIPNVKSYRGLIDGVFASYITFAPDATSFKGDNGGRAIRAEIDEKILGQGELSFEYWVRSSEFKERWDRIFAIGDDSAPGNRLDMEANENVTQFRLGLGMKNGAETKIIYNNNLWNGDWQHIVMSRKYDNGILTATVYINGEQIGTQTVENAVAPEIWETDKWTEQIYKENLYIGGMPGGYGVFRGDMAAFRIYNRILTENEISKNYVYGKAMLTPFIISSMDLYSYDGTIGSIKDNGTYGKHSTFYQSECVQKGTYKNLKGEDVAFFDMYNQGDIKGRACIYNDKFGKLEDYTVSAWVRIPDHTKRDWGTIIAHTDKHHYDTKIYGTELTENTFKLQSNDIKSANSVSIEPYIDTWAHFVFTKEWTKDANNADVLTLRAYVNGRELTDAKASGIVSDKSGYMGQTAFGLGSFFKTASDGGTLIDFSSFTIYGKALSNEEVALEYAAMCEDYMEYREIDMNPASESVLILELPKNIHINPQTVCRDSFYVTETQSGTEILITDVVFYPGMSGKVKLFTDESLDWKKTYQVMTTGILDEYGVEIIFTETITPHLEFESDLDNIFMQELIKTKTENGGTDVCITLTNSSKLPYNAECCLALYKNNRMVFIDIKEVSLDGEQIKTVSFNEIPEVFSDWWNAKIFVFKSVKSLQPVKNSGYAFLK